MPSPLHNNALNLRHSSALLQADTTGISQANVNRPIRQDQQSTSQDASALQVFQPPAMTPPRLPTSMVLQDEPSSIEPPTVSGSENTFTAFETKINESIKDALQTPQPAKNNRDEFRRADNRQKIDLNQLVDRHELANQAGVNTAKRTFMQKLGGAVVVGLIGLALTTAAVLTGGAGFAIAAGMTAALALRMTADTQCAKMAIKNAEAKAAGLPPPHDLPMGTDSVANLFYKACPSSWSDKTRKLVARLGSFGTDAVLQAASGLLVGGAAMLPLVSVGITLMGINHAVRAMKRDLPDVETSIRDEVQTASDVESNSVESAFSERPKDSLEGRMQDAASQLAWAKEEIVKLAPSLEKEALMQAVQDKEDQLDGQIDKLARLIETLPFEASLPPPALFKESSKTVGLGVQMMGLDYGVESGVAALSGVQGVDFTSSALELGLTLVELHKNNQQLQNGRDFLTKTNPDFAALHQRILNEKGIQRPSIDAFEMEMTVEETMTQMHNFIRA
jgi:hypothetical protein